MVGLHTEYFLLQIEYRSEQVTDLVALTGLYREIIVPASFL